MTKQRGGRPGVLVLDGDPPTARELAELPSNAFIVAADGGANTLVHAGVWPDVVVGDMEGIEPDVLATLADRGVAIEQHPEHKDDIDGILAFDRLLAAQPASILVLGALGGRTAMALANLEILRRCLDSDVPARIGAATETIHLLGPGGRLEIGGGAGRVFNVLPDTAEATLSVTGSAYDVDALTMMRGSSRGVSNEVVGEVATIMVQRGRVLVVVERTGGPPRALDTNA